MTKQKTYFIIFLIILNIFSYHTIYSQKYCLAIDYTPVLNTSDFNNVFGGQNGNRIKLDKKGLIKEMEFIAFPNTLFEIIETIIKDNYNIYKITTEDYKYSSTPLYIDSRFVKLYDKKPDNRVINLPAKEKIIENLKSLIGYQYMWGGNYAQGIPHLLEYYPPKEKIDKETKSLWMLEGVDCSGLLYQSTNGFTPRNTSSLTSFGNGIEIKNKSTDEILNIIQPLDLIVWNGHVVIVLDENAIIESTPPSGVVSSNLIERLKDIMKERKPADEWNSNSGKKFVIRRWFD